MSIQSLDNIVLGESKVEVRRYGSTGSYRDVGALKKAVFNPKPRVHKFTSMGYDGPVKAQKVGFEGKLTMTMQETHLTNLVMILGDDPVADVYSAGDYYKYQGGNTDNNDSVFWEVKITELHNRGAATVPVYLVLYKVMFEEGTEIKFGEEEESIFEAVGFTYADTDNGGHHFEYYHPTSGGVLP
ncbi:MAG: hypothetical protein D6712_17855 [Chloroflexi bacterium]|nr:MAG: hypothetical protein D6712_17855 [Chloroflexota bacterium]